MRTNYTNAERRRTGFGRLSFAATGGVRMFRDDSSRSRMRRFRLRASAWWAATWIALAAGHAEAQSRHATTDADVVATWSRDLLAKAEGYVERAIAAEQIVQRSRTSVDAGNAEALDPTTWPAAYADVIRKRVETTGLVRPVRVAARRPDGREYASQPENLYSMELTAQGVLKLAIRRVLRNHGLPEYLLAVPWIESGFNAHARSPKGALGLWQLMPDTARRFGLKVNGDVDERFDPILSTHAAARYLQELYSNWRDWELALAAYNAGEGRVATALNSSPRRSFFELSRRRLLPAETRNYVPAVLDAAQSMKSRQARASSEVFSAAQNDHPESLGGQ